MFTDTVSGAADGSDDDAPLAQADAQKILALATAANVTPKEWATLLGAIPAARSRILRIVNATYGSLHWRMASVGQAIAYLGFNTVKSLACVLAGAQRTPSRDGTHRLSS